MINLVSTSDQIQVVTDSAGSIEAHCSFVDLSGTTVTPGRTNTPAITTATTTAILPAPAASTYRNLKFCMVTNTGFSNNVVTIQHTDGTNVERLYRANLSIGDSIAYVDGAGWQHLSEAGATGIFSGVVVQDYEEVVPNLGTVSTTTLAIDMHAGNVQQVTLGASLTLSVTNAAAIGKSSTLTLYIHQDATGSRVITWPTLMTGTTAPTALKTAAGALNVVTLESIDGGSSWMIKVVE